MTDAFVIEVRGETAGLVVRHAKSFVFYASTHRFNAIDGQYFAQPADAERAARRLIERGQTIDTAASPRYEGKISLGTANVRPYPIPSRAA